MYEDFSTLLRSYRERRGRSRNALARQAGVDPAYLTHIENRNRGAPSVHIVEALARQLRLSELEWDRFLFAADCIPLSLRHVGEWEDTLFDVARVLANPNLTVKERDAFRDVVRTVAARWSQTAHT